VSANSSIVFVLAGLAILLTLYLAARPASTRGRGGKILAFLGIFALPVLVVAFGAGSHMEHSKSTQFCLSCHVMQDYGRSLRVDDAEFLPASHFQNRRIPNEQACFTCHTEYTLYGDLSAKLRGLKHVWVQYLGTIPDTVHLYEKYSNRECLHCHQGARTFEEGGPHAESPAIRDSILADTKSCMTSGCHDVVHNVHELKDAELWAPRSTKPTGGNDGTAH
jgi:cytochrome c-type protein NapC